MFAFTFVRPGARRATPGVLRLRFMDVTAKIRRILEELGHSIATPSEAREILALKGGDRVGF